jgi:poly(A) polymerase
VTTTLLATQTPDFWNLLGERIHKASAINGRILLVGGSVRDHFVKIHHAHLSIPESLDLDLVVEAEGGAESLALALHRSAPDEFSVPHELGRGYPIWQLLWEVPRIGSVELQIADTQSEMFPDPNTRQRITRFGSLMEDCERRDFTVNMLYWDLQKRELLDPSGVGLEDLKRGWIRGHPRVSTRKIFRDDPLRMLRALRFHGRFGWPIAEETWSALREEFERVAILSPERVRDEILKMCEGGYFAEVLDLLQKESLLHHLIPEALPMVGCGQDTIYHSEGDVWVHTLMVMRAAPPNALLQLAAFLHDWGKPDTRAVREDGRVTFLNHEKFSTDRARAWLKKWRFPKELSEDVLTLVALHLRGGDVMAWKSLKPARKLLRDAGDQIENLLLLIEADSSASLGPDGKARLDHIPLLKKRIAEASSIASTPKSVVSGRRIMEEMGILEGPRIKVLKEQAQDLYEDALLKGQTLSESEIIELLKKSISKGS